jgi:hypothetical protein
MAAAAIANRTSGGNHESDDDGKTSVRLRGALPGAVGCIAVSAITARLFMLGKTGDHWLAAMFVAAVCGIAGWKLTVILCTRWKDIKQLDVLRQHGPYDRREFVAPQEAVSQVGDDARGPNMWGAP